MGAAVTDLVQFYFNGAVTINNAIIVNSAAGQGGVDIGAFRSESTGVVLAGSLNANLADAVFSAANTAGRTISVTGAISGNSGLTVTSSGSASITLTLNNAGTANSYAGNTTISTANATLALGRADQISNGAGKGNLIITSGTFKMGGFSETINGLSGNGTVDGVSGTPTLTIGDNDATSTFSGVIKNTAGTLALTKIGNGTLTLSGANTFSGSTAISAGNLSISSVSSLGSTSGINLSNAAALVYTGGAASLDRAITITTGTGTIRNSGSGLLTLSGGLTKNGTTLTLAGGSSGITVSGVISGSSANSDLTVDGGTVNLTNTNTYNGPTTIINSGTLNANAVGALPTSTLSAVTINGSSTLALGASQSVASLSSTAGSSVTLGSNTLTINGSSTTTYSGAISGTGNLVKNGSGTQTLAGASTYTGATTVNSGTLTAAAANALGNSTVINVTGGSFLVTAANAVNDNAAVNLGGGRMALSGNFDETVGLLTLSANSTIDFSGFGGTLRFGGIGSWASGATLAIWNWSGTTQYGTQINNYATPSNIVFTNNSNLTANLGLISFYSDSGNSFVGNGFQQGFSPGGGTEIIAVPEAETYFYAVALLAGVLVQFIRRRAKQKFLELYPQT
jgi:autotransporter-associated beta strand protein